MKRNSNGSRLTLTNAQTYRPEDKLCNTHVPGLRGPPGHARARTLISNSNVGTRDLARTRSPNNPRLPREGFVIPVGPHEHKRSQTRVRAVAHLELFQWSTSLGQLRPHMGPSRFSRPSYTSLCAGCCCRATQRPFLGNARHGSHSQNC